MGKDVIIACDFSSKRELLKFLNKMKGDNLNLYCKVGMELFNAGALEGFDPVKIIKSRGYKVFLDLKLKDIPNTVSSTIKVLVKAGVDMINVHADGGSKMMMEVVKAVDEVVKRNNRPILLGVTVLTSMSEEELRGELNINRTSLEQVVSLAELCKKSGFDGVVCSPQEVLAVKEACGEDFITVTPGIRFGYSVKDDQKRVATPACANIMGADYIVVGRPITQAADPVEVYNTCKRDFTETITDTTKLESAEAYIKGLKTKYNKNHKEAAAEAILDSGSVTFNFKDPYLLNSGIASPIYCDNRELYGAPMERKIIINALTDLVQKEFPPAEVLMGTPLSGIPYAAFVADALNIPMGFVRKEAKDHGKGKKIEGRVVQGTKVIVIEDLVSSGASVIDVIQALKAVGANVLGVASIVRNNPVDLSPNFIDLGVKYVYLTDMNLIAKMALEKGVCAKNEYDSFLKYASNPKDESWMITEAENNINNKRLAKKENK